MSQPVTDRAAASRLDAVRRLSPQAAGDLDDVMVPCRVCRTPTSVATYILAAVKRWNQGERELAESTEASDLFHKPEFIHSHEIVACPGPCTLQVRADIARAAAVEYATTEAELDALKAGHLSPEGAGWLRRHGHGDRVSAYYASTPTTERR